MQIGCLRNQFDISDFDLDDTGKRNAISRSMNESVQTDSREYREETVSEAVNPVPPDPSTILVIDDDPLVLQTVKSLLVKRGFNVLTSSSAPKGLDMIRYAGDIRIVVLDYSMPKLNGDEALKFIKQLSPNAKVIGLTAMKLDSLPKEYLDGIDKLLKKPVVAATLISAVDELLGTRETASAAIEPC